MNKALLLNVKNLSISFGNTKNSVEAVHSISFHINRNEILGVVGESGSGKSVTAMTILGLLSKKESLVSGELLFEGQDLLKQTNEHIRKLRGSKIAMIFQEPMTALNPSITVGEQVSEIIRLSLKTS